MHHQESLTHVELVDGYEEPEVERLLQMLETMLKNIDLINLFQHSIKHFVIFYLYLVHI